MAERYLLLNLPARPVLDYKQPMCSSVIVSCVVGSTEHTFSMLAVGIGRRCNEVGGWLRLRRGCWRRRHQRQHTVGDAASGEWSTICVAAAALLALPTQHGAVCQALEAHQESGDWRDVCWLSELKTAGKADRSRCSHAVHSLWAGFVQTRLWRQGRRWLPNYVTRLTTT